MRHQRDACPEHRQGIGHHRDDLPLLRRDHRLATHGNVRTTSFGPWRSAPPPAPAPSSERPCVDVPAPFQRIGGALLDALADPPQLPGSDPQRRHTSASVEFFLEDSRKICHFCSGVRRVRRCCRSLTCCSSPGVYHPSCQWGPSVWDFPAVRADGRSDATHMASHDTRAPVIAAGYRWPCPQV